MIERYVTRKINGEHYLVGTKRIARKTCDFAITFPHKPVRGLQLKDEKKRLQWVVVPNSTFDPGQEKSIENRPYVLQHKPLPHPSEERQKRIKKNVRVLFLAKHDMVDLLEALDDKEKLERMKEQLKQIKREVAAEWHG